MHTNTTTVRIPRARRTRTTTHHRPTTKGNLRRQHAAAQTATVRYFDGVVTSSLLGEG